MLGCIKGSLSNKRMLGLQIGLVAIEERDTSLQIDPNFPKGNRIEWMSVLKSRRGVHEG